jgi:preprotein translocase subunit SecE
MSTQKTADEKPRRGRWPFGGGASETPVEVEAPERGMTAPKGRATPGRRNTPEEEETRRSGNIVVRTVGGIREYFLGVQSELNKVSWPTREETRRLSTIVLVATLISSIVLGIITLGYSELFRIGVNQPALFLGFFVIVLIVGFVIYRRSNRDSASPF